MDVYDYMGKASDTAQYEGALDPEHIGGLSYLAMGLGGETGEVLDHIKKMYRKGVTPKDYAKLAELKEEVGDVCWYLFMLINTLGWDPQVIFQENIDKLSGRAAEGTIKER